MIDADHPGQVSDQLPMLVWLAMHVSWQDHLPAVQCISLPVMEIYSFCEILRFQCDYLLHNDSHGSQQEVIAS